MSLLPLQSSLRGLSSFCPGGVFPPDVLHSSAAETGTATAETSIATPIATAIATSAASVTFVLLSSRKLVNERKMIRL